MQRLNGSDQGILLPAVAIESRPIRQLVRNKDVRVKVSQHHRQLLVQLEPPVRPYRRA